MNIVEASDACRLQAAGATRVGIVGAVASKNGLRSPFDWERLRRLCPGVVSFELKYLSVDVDELGKQRIGFNSIPQYCLTLVT